MGIAQTIGQRIRNYRLQNKLSQEELAERAGCHHTYIGQIERGEKNASIESIRLHLHLEFHFQNCLNFLAAKHRKRMTMHTKLMSLLQLNPQKNKRSFMRFFIRSKNIKIFENISRLYCLKYERLFFWKNQFCYNIILMYKRILPIS